MNLELSYSTKIYKVIKSSYLQNIFFLPPTDNVNHEYVNAIDTEK